MTETTQDNSPETNQPQGDENTVSSPAASAEDTIKAASDAAAEEIAALKDRLLRTMAEMENLRKRADRDRQDASKYAVSSFARDLLNVSDNLRRALDSTNAEELTDAAKSLYDGIDMTERELIRTFEKAGIRKIEPLGEKYDHNLHEAMFEVPSADQPAGTIIQVVQAGYVLHDRLLRAARVGITKAAEGSSADQKIDTRV